MCPVTKKKKLSFASSGFPIKQDIGGNFKTKPGLI